MKCIWEHNGQDTLLHSADLIGAYTRGENLRIALQKMPDEVAAYAQWSGNVCEPDPSFEIIQEKQSDLQISDADSDILFDSEKAPLTQEEYEKLKALALKSASDFYTLYTSIPDKRVSCLPIRNTFYGRAPRTAQDMYEHTKNVNSYYFGEIGVDVDNQGNIYDCRQRGFQFLEQTADFLRNPVIEGSYGELWSVRKMLRRFVWHDRIHAKAMYRMALQIFDESQIANPFYFRV